MLLMLTSIFLFLLVYDLVSRGWEQSIFLKAFVFVGSLMILANLYLAFSWYSNWISNNPGQWLPSITYRPATTNLFAPFMYLTFHMSIPLFFATKRIFNKIFLGLIMASSLFVLYLTSSRSGWLAIFFGLIIWGSYFIFKEKTIFSLIINKFKSNKYLLFGTILLTIIFIFVGGILLYKQSIHPTHGNIFTSRSTLWGPAFTSFQNNPLFGQGQFTYGTSFLAENSTPPESVYVHAHSLYINLLAEMGVLGFVALLIFGVAYLKRLKLSFDQTKEKYIIVAIFAYLISFCVHCIFDSLHLEPALIWPLAILTGVAIANTTKEVEDQISHRPWWVLLLVGFAWFGIWTITPYYQAVELANSNQWQPAYEKFQQAVERDPWNGLAHQQLALSAAVLAQQGQQEMLDIATTALQTTIQHEPSWALNHANLAVLYLANNQPDQAVLEAQNAVKLAPRAPLYALNMGTILEQTGDTDQAQSAYLQALDLNPTWATASFWQESSLRANMLDSWLQDHPASPARTLEESQKILANNPHVSWAYNQLAKVQLEQNDLEAARQTLENAGMAYVNSTSDSIETQWLWAEYYSKTGDFTKAVEIGTYAIKHYNSFGVFGPGSFGVLQYAPRMFRMNAMALEIVPQMVDIPIPAIWLERSEFLNTWQERVQ